jgi:hypothetical protein
MPFHFISPLSAFAPLDISITPPFSIITLADIIDYAIFSAIADYR